MLSSKEPPLDGTDHLELYTLSGLCWISAFGDLAIFYDPLLLSAQQGH